MIYRGLKLRAQSRVLRHVSRKTIRRHFSKEDVLKVAKRIAETPHNEAVEGPVPFTLYDGAEKCTWKSQQAPESPHKAMNQVNGIGKSGDTIVDSVLDLVGGTPMVRLSRFAEKHDIKCDLVAKCEFFSAGGSVKDRIGLRMLEDAEQSGRIKPGDTLIEPTSGNTGIGLSLAAAVKGYNMIITMPQKMSGEKKNTMQAFGAEIFRTPTAAAWNDTNSHIALALRMEQQLENAHVLDQYKNPSNPLAHYENTAEEIIKQTGGKIDYMIMTAGTGGTVTGIARKLKEKCPDCKVIAVDPKGSILALPDNLNDEGKNCPYHVEGIGYDFIPTVLDRPIVDHWIKSGDQESFYAARDIIRTEGLLVGGSSGSCMSAAVKYIKENNIGSDKRVVLLFPDSVRNYMYKFLDDEWMRSEGFLNDTFVEQPADVEPKTGEWVQGADLGLSTKAVHAGVAPDEKTGAILTPVYQSTTFVQQSVGKYLEKGYSYTRSGNPTVRALEVKIAALEGGYGATAVGTGMSGTTLLIAGLMNAGDHCVIANCTYGGTNRICREQFVPLGMEFDFIDFSDLDNIRKHIKPNTKILFSETPSNPTLQIADIEAISAIAKEHGALHICDSTFATPYMVRPLDWGADLVLQSLTKYYDGHNIGAGGAVIAATKELDDRMHFVQNMHGNIMTPQTAYMISQTSKTMGLRIERQSKSAMRIAKFLDKHPMVTKVVYPGLNSFPQKSLADKYHRNGLHGGMLWFDLQGGDTNAIKLMDTVQRPWSLCENLGATESIITACAVMTHANMIKEDRLKAGISDGFIRISVGIEDSDDLLRALKAALDKL